MPRWVDARDGEEEEAEDESTSEEEDEGDVEEQADDDEEDEQEAADANDRILSNAGAGPSGQRQKISIPLGRKDLVCHVSGCSSLHSFLLILLLYFIQF